MRENGTLVYLFGDHLGSTSLVANRDGTTKAQQLYKAWGEKRYPSGASTLPTTFRFTGQRESSTGLYYYRARFYDPLTGRFIQADSIVPNAGDPASFDRYAYVRNSPVNFVDPSGHHTIHATHSWECGPDGIKCDESGNINHQHHPDEVDASALSPSGIAAYGVYMDMWNDKSGWWWLYPDLGVCLIN